MPFTAATLADFMVAKLGASGAALGLTDDSAAIAEAVNDVAAILSVDDVAELTDDLKTRTFAEWQAWRAAKAAATSQYDLKAGSADLKRSQFFEHIAMMLADAEAAASRYSEAADVIHGGGGAAYVSGVSTAGSPYGYAADEWA